MSATTVQAVVAAAQQLSPTEQLEVIQALTRTLKQSYSDISARSSVAGLAVQGLPSTVRPALPVVDLLTLAADFWPEDETADDIQAYLAQQRVADRLYDLGEREEPL